MLERMKIMQSDFSKVQYIHKMVIFYNKNKMILIFHILRTPIF